MKKDVLLIILIEVIVLNYSTSIPSNYQYFNSDKIGGFSPADYCPISMGY